VRRIKYKKTRRVQPNNYEYTGVHKFEAVAMQLFIYNNEKFEEFTELTVPQLQEVLDNHQGGDYVMWLNVHGLHDVEIIKQVGAVTHLDTPMISDILNTSRRAKLEELNDMLFFSIKSVLPQDESDTVKVEQISFVLRENFIISFQEKRSDYFTHIRERIRTHAGIVRTKKSDYLLYLLLDAIMENFFITLEHFEDKTEKMINDAKICYDQEILEQIEHIREDINFLKRSILPLRDALFNLKSILDHVSHSAEKSNKTYFTRLHQKTFEILEQIEYDMHAVDSASSLFFATQSQRMNQIMKTLTIFSVIFMPLTFIVGVYGMNFENMPELRTENGYFIVLWSMLAIVIVMIIYFKKKRWF
jgi:magnesium transporter